MGLEDGSAEGASSQQLPEGHPPRQGQLGSRHKCQGLRCSNFVEWARDRQVREFFSGGGPGPPPRPRRDDQPLRCWRTCRRCGVIACVFVFEPGRWRVGNRQARGRRMAGQECAGNDAQRQHQRGQMLLTGMHERALQPGIQVARLRAIRRLHCHRL